MKTIQLLVILSLGILFLNKELHATVYSSKAKGNWSNPTTWNPSAVPNSVTDTVYIAKNFPVVVDGNYTVASLFLQDTLRYDTTNNFSLHVDKDIFIYNSGGPTNWKGVLEPSQPYTTGDGPHHSLYIGGNFGVNNVFTSKVMAQDLSGSRTIKVYFENSGNSNVTSSGSLTFHYLVINKQNANDTVVLYSNITTPFLGLQKGTLNNNSATVTITTGGGVSRNTGIITKAPVFSGNSQIHYEGTTLVTSGPELPSSVDLLTINSSSGVQLNKNVLVTGLLDLLGGTIITGVNVLQVATGATVTRKYGYVDGYLQKNSDVGNNISMTFEVGTNSGYSPVVLNFGTITTGGNITVSARETKHPNVADSNNVIQRYWNIFNTTMFKETYSATFTYLPTDFSTSFQENNYETSLQLGEYDGGIWSLFVSGAASTYGGSNDGGTIVIEDLSSFGDFTFGLTNALPVELSPLTASLHNGIVSLYWSTTTEINNYGFEIQKAVMNNPSVNNQNKTWKTVGFVDGNSTTNVQKDYIYTDTDVKPGIYLYRLKQIDRNGRFQYSNEAAILFPAKTSVAQNYPNPFNPTTTIRFEVSEKKMVRLKVYDIVGKEVATLVNEELEIGKHVTIFDGSNLPSGIYFYTLTTGNFVETKKLVLMK